MQEKLKSQHFVLFIINFLSRIQGYDTYLFQVLSIFSIKLSHTNNKFLRSNLNHRILLNAESNVVLIFYSKFKNIVFRNIFSPSIKRKCYNESMLKIKIIYI